MCQPDVGANLMFARRTKTGIKPMFENEFEAIASDIGSQTIVVRVGIGDVYDFMLFFETLNFLPIKA
jgi:hypothetical protein